MISQYLLKQGKIARGLFYTYFRRQATPYSETEWWDNAFYVAGVSDARTISAEKSIKTAHYHYASLELLILRHFCNEGITLDGASVLDIGSGSGHWVDFYRSLGADRVTAVDVSKTAVQHLRNKYAGDRCITILEGTAFAAIKATDARFDAINAIGVMFHIVDDDKLAESVGALAKALKPGGILVISGHFGYLHGINLQIDRHNQINKRIRSRFFWRRLLVGAGLTELHYYANNAYLRVADTLPENNLLLARKRAPSEEPT